MTPLQHSQGHIQLRTVGTKDLSSSYVQCPTHTSSHLTEHRRTTNTFCPILNDTPHSPQSSRPPYEAVTHARQL